MVFKEILELNGFILDYILGEVENKWGYNDKDLSSKFRTKDKKRT